MTKAEKKFEELAAMGIKRDSERKIPYHMRKRNERCRLLNIVTAHEDMLREKMEAMVGVAELAEEQAAYHKAQAEALYAAPAAEDELFALLMTGGFGQSEAYNFHNAKADEMFNAAQGYRAKAAELLEELRNVPVAYYGV